MRQVSKSLEDYRDEIAAQWALCKKSINTAKSSPQHAREFAKQAGQDFQKMGQLVDDCSRQYGQEAATQSLHKAVEGDEDLFEHLLNMSETPKPARGEREPLA